MKRSIKFILTIAISLMLLSFAASAVNGGYLAVAVGRGTVVSSDGLITTLEPFSDGESIKDMFRVPVFVNESTYVPMSLIFERMGVESNVDSYTGKIVFQKPNKKSISVYGLADRAVNCKKIEVLENKITFYPVEGAAVTETFDVYNYLGISYIPARYLERFGVLIKWDSANSVVYISYGETDANIKDFERIYFMEEGAEKQRAFDRFFEKVTTAPNFKKALDEYLGTKRETSNNQNGGYIQPYNGKNYFPDINIENSGWFTKVGEDSRQLCYATDGNCEYIYYIERATQTLRRYRLGAESNDEAVKLPSGLAGKKITHITHYDGNIFYVAYDDINQGGYIYMSRVGSEVNCTVRVTKDRAWNFHITPAYKLYFTNYDEGYRLTSIDLRSIENTEAFVANPSAGVLSDIVNFTPMQTFAFDTQNDIDYYYIDIVSGSLIHSSRNHNTGIEVLSPGTEGALRHFLNVAPVNGQKSVIYVEYPGGKKWDFSKSKIMLYNLETKTEKVIYECDFAVNGLCFYNGKIYFTDTAYSSLYQIENAGTSLKVKVSKIG